MYGRSFDNAQAELPKKKRVGSELKPNWAFFAVALFAFKTVRADQTVLFVYLSGVGAIVGAGNSPLRGQVTICYHQPSHHDAGGSAAFSAAGSCGFLSFTMWFAAAASK